MVLNSSALEIDPWLEFAQNIVDAVGILDEDVAETVIHSFAKVHRDEFLPPELVKYAFEDLTLPIGAGQFTVKPSIIARMLGLIGLRKRMRILEIGCGCGYLSALMAKAGATVFAVEKEAALAQLTRKNLDRLGFQNIIIRTGAGRNGWQDYAPYDAIIVAKALQNEPTTLLEQLASPNGKLVATIGVENNQHLSLWENSASGINCYKLEQCCL